MPAITTYQATVNCASPDDAAAVATWLPTADWSSQRYPNVPGPRSSDPPSSATASGPVVTAQWAAGLVPPQPDALSDVLALAPAVVTGHSGAGAVVTWSP
jgi:hypothetical protein